MRWLVLLTLALPAGAQTGSTGIDCFCTDRSGARVELGQVICMDVDNRQYRARCEMSLNVPMWREVSKDCGTSS